MFRRVLCLLLLSLIAASCGAPAATQEPSAPTAEQATLEPTLQALIPDTPTPTQTPLPTPSPTETPLPPLELPTEIPSAPALLAWDGVPTYLGDSQPGYAFRVLYDPATWALTQDQFGFPALGHRAIPYCVISVTSGRGLPPNISVEHETLYAKTVTFDVGAAYENGVKKFVTYTGGDGIIFTAFQVSFEEQADQCLADAETVLTTLRSVPSFQATPTP
ncbi:MAG: hypothetical protein ACOYYF_07060 [Chloroflexota bacterium]|nr:hypothetical protein [Chloroflexota bacterium]MBI5704391.1 hypothetical protein [Chloroflexota bacterium]